MNNQNIPLIILISLLSLIILGGSAFAIYMATMKRNTSTQSTTKVLPASVSPAALPTSQASSDSKDSTNAGLEADLSKTDKELDAINTDTAAADAGLSDTQTDLSE